MTATGSDTYTYDADGNQTQRVVGGNTYNLTYDAENRLIQVNGVLTATFVYDGDGNRVKGTVAGSTITYLGNYFEWTGSTSSMKKYYYEGSIKVAMRTGTSTINYLLGDHLGSNSITTSSSGVKNSEIRYMPWGTTRYTSGTSPTTFQYTGQRNESNLGLLFYNARWYDPYLNRWISPDSIIPSGVQGLDRYAYVNNNPLRYTDPSGHVRCSIDDDVCISGQKSYKALIAWKYGVKIEEENKMTWSNTNLETVYLSLGFINDKLGGNLKSKIAGTTFTITDGGDQYYGWTSDKNSVYFHVASNSTSVPAINFIHETGHILDFRKESAYSNSINGDPNWTADGFVDSSILLGNVDEQIQALPNEAYDSGEYWSDAFANYILDNIKLSEEAGNAMRNFVKYTLNPQPPPANYNRGWNET